MSNLTKTFFTVAIVYFSIHLLGGWSFCQENFCPGDNERDWVYEYTDDNGQKYIVIDNKPILKEQWQQKLGTGPYNKDKE